MLILDYCQLIGLNRPFVVVNYEEPSIHIKILVGKKLATQSYLIDFIEVI